MFYNFRVSRRFIPPSPPPPPRAPAVILFALVVRCRDFGNLYFYCGRGSSWVDASFRRFVIAWDPDVLFLRAEACTRPLKPARRFDINQVFKSFLFFMTIKQRSILCEAFLPTVPARCVVLAYISAVAQMPRHMCVALVPPRCVENDNGRGKEGFYQRICANSGRNNGTEKRRAVWLTRPVSKANVEGAKGHGRQSQPRCMSIVVPQRIPALDWYSSPCTVRLDAPPVL